MKKSHLKSKFSEKYFINEFYRKSFHIGLGIFLILIYFILGKFLATLTYAILLFLAILSDAIRLRIYIEYPLKRIAETIARSYERTYLGAHTYFLAGILVAAIFFDEISFIAAAIVVTIIDPIMSISGILFNGLKHPYNKEKSVIGSLIGALVAFFIFYTFMSTIKAIILSIIVYIIDSIPLPFSDNIIYPLIIGLLTYLIWI